MQLSPTGCSERAAQQSNLSRPSGTEKLQRAAPPAWRHFFHSFKTEFVYFLSESAKIVMIVIMILWI